MALRRPPTRVELKADDIKEYEQVSGLARCPVFLNATIFRLFEFNKILACSHIFAFHLCFHSFFSSTKMKASWRSRIQRSIVPVTVTFRSERVAFTSMFDRSRPAIEQQLVEEQQRHQQVQPLNALG